MSTKTLDQFIDRVGFAPQRVRKAGVYVAMYGFAAIFVIPYVYMLSVSFQSEALIFDRSPHLIPPLTELTLQWYVILLNRAPMIQWIINTFIVAGAATVMVIVLDTMIAFALTRLEWPGRRLVISLILASFLVPAVINLVPLFQLITDLGLLNTYPGVFLPLASGALGVFLLIQFFRDIPEELQEAARMDGFSTFNIYLRIVLPLMRPAITALALFTFVGTWNNFLWPLVVLQSESMYTLPVGLETIPSQYTTAQRQGFILAAASIASFPLILLFLLMQDKLISAIQRQGTVG